MAEGNANASASADDSWMLGSEEVCDVYCQSCTNVGAQIPAQGYCVNCEEFFCGNCCQEHKKFNVTRNHVIKNKDEATERKTTVKHKVDYTFVDKCPFHDSEHIKFVCQSCDVIGCSACMTTCHRACDQVHYIPSIIHKAEVDKGYRKTKQDVGQVLQAISEDHLDLASSKEAVQAYKTRALQQLEQERAKINTYLDCLEDKFKTQVGIVQDEDTDKIAKTEELLKTVSLDMQSIQGKILAAEDGHAIRKFIATKTTQEALIAIEKQLDSMRKHTGPRR